MLNRNGQFLTLLTLLVKVIANEIDFLINKEIFIFLCQYLDADIHHHLGLSLLPTIIILLLGWLTTGDMLTEVGIFVLFL